MILKWSLVVFFTILLSSIGQSQQTTINRMGYRFYCHGQQCYALGNNSAPILDENGRDFSRRALNSMEQSLILSCIDRSNLRQGSQDYICIEDQCRLMASNNSRNVSINDFNINSEYTLTVGDQIYGCASNNSEPGCLLKLNNGAYDAATERRRSHLEQRATGICLGQNCFSCIRTVCESLSDRSVSIARVDLIVQMHTMGRFFESRENRVDETRQNFRCEMRGHHQSVKEVLTNNNGLEVDSAH